MVAIKASKTFQHSFKAGSPGIYTSLDLEARSFEKCITIIDNINSHTYVSVY